MDQLVVGTKLCQIVAMETAQHWDRLPKNQPAEIAMFQISEVQESPAFNGRRRFLTLRPKANAATDFAKAKELGYEP